MCQHSLEIEYLLNSCYCYCCCCCCFDLLDKGQLIFVFSVVPIAVVYSPLSCYLPSEGVHVISWLCSCNFFFLITLISSAFSGFLYIMVASANSLSFRKSCAATGINTILSLKLIGSSSFGGFCIFISCAGSSSCRFVLGRRVLPQGR